MGAQGSRDWAHAAVHSPTRPALYSPLVCVCAGKAVVARPRNCTTCRECVRENGWDERIELLRDNQHFIFSIESTGVMPARSIMLEAVRILAQKARAVLAAAGGTSGSGGLGDVPIMPPGAAREHSQAAMRSAEDEDS